MNRKELIEKLELVLPAVAVNNLVEVYTRFMFREKTLSAYNDQIGIVTKLKSEQPFAVNAKILLGLLNNSGSDDVELKVEKEGLHIQAGKSTFKMPYFKEDEFLFEEPKEKYAVNLPLNAILVAGIELCLTTVSRDQAMNAIMGVCITDNCLYSTDGDAITSYELDSKIKGKYTLPNAFCDTLIKLMAETKSLEGGEGALEINDQWAKATGNGFILYGRMIENAPLDHEELISQTLGDEEVPFIAIPAGLTEALARARVVADPESAKTSLKVEKGKLKLNTNTHMGLVKDEVAIKGHPDVEADVHALLVARSVAICDRLAILPNATAYRLGEKVLQVVSNVGE